MSEITERPSRARTIIIVVATFVILAGVVVGITYLTGGGTTPPAAEPTSTAGPDTETTAPDDEGANEEEDDVQISPSPGAVLPEPMGGQEAIDALGDKISVVAQRNGKTVEQIEDLLLRDKTAEVSTDGFIRYIDTFKN